MISYLKRPAALVIALTLAACSSMDDNNQGATGGAGGGSLSSNDRQFVTMAAQASWAEIATGQIAQRQGASDAVRQFGQRMVQDHTMANKELASIAGRLGMMPPKEPDAKHQADAKMLAALSGSEFDRQYSRHMVMDHEMTVALFTKEAQGGDEAALKQFATKQLPILQDHLRMARGLTGE